jgi:cell division topological specificity factor minE
MSFFNLFKKNRANSAAIAKERLQIIVAHRRSQGSQPQFLETMKKEILEVVKKYFAIDLEDISADFSRKGEIEMLELNINLHNKEAPVEDGQADDGDIHE